MLYFLVTLLVFLLPVESQILKGTKWCGNGNIAKDYDDLGLLEDTDKCCREHDNCGVLIPISSSRYGLTNSNPFKPILHCDCDEKFRQCLKKVGGVIANLAGKIYFRAATQCIKEDYPILQCKRVSFKKVSLRCAEYELDKTQAKVYQFFDNVVYE